MKLVGVVVRLLALGAGASGVGLQGQGSVIQKVIEMLENYKLKVAKDLAAEEKEATAYAEYCDEETTTKEYAIKDGERKIAGIDAAIEDAEAQISAFDADVAKLGSEIASKQKDIMAAEDTRKAEKKDFEASESELEKAVEELEKAITMVKREGEEAETTPAPEFLQTGLRHAPQSAKAFAKTLAATLGSVIDAAWVGEHDAKALKAFMQSQETEDEGEGDLSLAKTRQEPAEEGSSVLQTLEDMKTKAEEALSKARQEEMNADFNYQMMKQKLVGASQLAEKNLGASKEGKTSLQETVGSAKGELADAKKAKMSDALYLKTLIAECKTAADDWTSRQAEAKGEIAALEKAKEILSGNVKVLVQHDDDFFSGNQDGGVAADSPVRAKLVSHLKNLGHKLHSYALSELAGASVADPFEKIKGIIEEMVAKLTAEMNEEATQKAFCDTEKKKGAAEKEEKSMRADELKNRVDSAKAKKASLADYIKDLQAQITEIDKSGSEAMKLREEERASYLVASKDYKDGAQAIEDAIKVLKDYYASVSLVQAKAGDASVIIGILENSQEEFTRMYMETETNEKEAEDAFKKLTQENAVTRTAKVAEAKGAESEIKTLTLSIEEGGQDYKLASKELDAVIEYLDKLKPQCEAKVMTYEEKRAKRQSEIDGLKEALSILDVPALVQTRKHA